MSAARSGRRPLISGNWKMNFDHHEALHAARDLGLRLQPADVSHLDVSVHPPFTDLRTVQSVLEPDGMPVALGAQNCAVEDAGAFTGEVSPLMLAKLHVDYVIVGHSERRRLFGETDEIVRAKMRAVMRNAMTPICCVGESAEERENGVTEDVLAGQVKAALDGTAPEAVAGMVIAYEPLWAIGSGAGGHAGRRPTRLPLDPGGGGPVRRRRCGPERPDPVRRLGERRKHRGHPPRGRMSTGHWWAGPASMWGSSWASSGPRHAPSSEFGSVSLGHEAQEEDDVLTAIIVVLQILASLALIFLILMHSGKGGGLSDMFGGSVGSAAAGSTVVEKNLDRITVTVAVIFAFTNLILILRLQ